MIARRRHKMTITKHYSGCFRISNNSALFGQIKKKGREWHAEIRRTNNGALVRFAGIWKRKVDAVEECEYIIERDG